LVKKVIFNGKLAIVISIFSNEIIQMQHLTTISIYFLLCEKMLATSVTLPMEMFFAAQNAANTMLPPEHRLRLNIKTLGINKEPVSTLSGIQLQPELGLTDSGLNPDLIYVPGLWRNPRTVVLNNRAFLEWLKEKYQSGSIISAVGTGCCFLAEAGLLDGKAATTHWHYFDQFQKDYPLVKLKRQYFITQATTLYCAASVNSLADLTVHFIKRFFGKTVASHVERHFSHEIRKAYETSVFFEATESPHPDEEITQIQIWLHDNYFKEVIFVQIAERFAMSLRTLNRRFKNALGKTPLEYLQEIRINTAKDLLKTSNLSINNIADKVGYSDVGHFSLLFKRHMSITPKAYRNTVRAKLFMTDNFNGEPQ
jgi:transcriptional regulator GlxA family with amidase domain